MQTEAEILALQNEDKVTFDEKQQDKVNKLIEDAMGRAGRQARKDSDKIKEQLDALKTELDQAKVDLINARTTSEKKDATDDIVALKATIAEMQSVQRLTQTEYENTRRALQAKDAEVKQAREQTINVRKDTILTQAASKINPFDVDDVVRATQDSLQWNAEYSRFEVIDPSTGQPRLNSGFEPMSIDDFMEEYAKKKPHMIRAGARFGTGSSESGGYDTSRSGKYDVKQIFGRGSDSKLATKLSLENPKEYQRLRVIAVEKGLIG